MLKKLWWKSNTHKKIRTYFLNDSYESIMKEQTEIRDREVTEQSDFYKREIYNKEQLYDLTIKTLKEEHARQLSVKDEKIEAEKRKLKQEIDKAIEMQKNATFAEDKFVRLALLFEELLYKVRKLIGHIQGLVIAEDGISELVDKIESERTREQEKIDRAFLRMKGELNEQT